MANTVNKNITYWLEKIYDAIAANTAAIEAQTEVIEEQNASDEEQDASDEEGE